MDNNRLTLRQGDCRDLLLTDPPYNLGPYSTGNMQFKWRGAINNDLAAWDREFDPDYFAAAQGRLAAVADCCKEQWL